METQCWALLLLLRALQSARKMLYSVLVHLEWRIVDHTASMCMASLPPFSAVASPCPDVYCFLLDSSLVGSGEGIGFQESTRTAWSCREIYPRLAFQLCSDWQSSKADWQKKALMWCLYALCQTGSLRLRSVLYEIPFLSVASLSSSESKDYSLSPTIPEDG